MSELKRQIDALESEIIQNKQAIAEDLALLKQDTKSPVFLTTAIIGGLALGFLLGNKHTTTFLRQKISQTPQLLKVGAKHIPTLLPIIARIFL